VPILARSLPTQLPRSRAMSFLRIIASWLVSLVLLLAVVTLNSSDDQNPRDAVIGALIFFMIAGVSYGYYTGLGWRGGSAGQVNAGGEATTGQCRLRLGEETKEAPIPLEKIRSKRGHPPTSNWAAKRNQS
jgi:hypothetical protein